MRRHDEKKEHRKKLFMSLFIVAIMTLSVLGYMIGRDAEEQSNYNDFKFFRSGNKYVTKINNQDVAFDYFPSSIENFNISDSIIEKIKNSVQIDSTSDSEDEYKEGISLLQFELSRALQMNNQFIRNGFTTNKVKQ